LLAAANGEDWKPLCSRGHQRHALSPDAFENLGSFLVGQAVLGSYDVPTASLSQGDARQAVIAAILTSPLWPLLGMALGAILRSTASAITSVMALLFAPAMFGGLLPDWWQENFLAYLPGSAGDSLLQSNPDSDSLTYLDPPVAIAVILVWLTLFIGTAVVLMKRRDV
jgi:ABC-2 type transport system permease protein